MRPFIDLTDLGLYLKKDLSADQLGIICIDSACEIIRGYTHQMINYEEADGMTLDGTGTRVLHLPELPVVELIQVSTFDDDDEETELDPTEYQLGRSGDLWKKGTDTPWTSASVWPKGIANIGVIYSHGWAVDEVMVASGSGSGSSDDIGQIDRVPSDIRRIALMLAQRLYISAGTSPPVSSETMGSYSYSTGGAAAGSEQLLVAEQRVLERYRQRGVA